MEHRRTPVESPLVQSPVLKDITLGDTAVKDTLRSYPPQCRVSTPGSEPRLCLTCIHRTIPGKPGRGNLDAELLRCTCIGKRVHPVLWCILWLIPCSMSPAASRVSSDSDGLRMAGESLRRAEALDVTRKNLRHSQTRLTRGRWLTVEVI